MPLLAAALGMVVALSVASRSSQAQSISGVILSAANGEPLAYGTVLLVESGRGRFADAAGEFVLAGLVNGTYRVRARQIGYAAVDTTISVGDAPVRVVFRLQPIVLQLATVPIVVGPVRECVLTGIPDSALNPQLASVFSQLRDNVDRYRLLLDEYPFHYRREKHQFVRVVEGGEVAHMFDTVAYLSRDEASYQLGAVIHDVVGPDGERHQRMYVPTFRDLADTVFQALHCFRFAGREHGSIRIDFKPASGIMTPDIEGSIYLDARRYVVRRAVFRLTKPGAAVPPILGLTVTTMFSELVPLVPVVGGIRSEQPLPPMHLGSAIQRVFPDAIEEDRLLDYAFEGEGFGARAPPVAAPPPEP
jgi:hypothetical protein